ncbi:beta strand repeat-containing protein [Jatrophihabitans sp. YIM 134969]
MSTSVVRVRAVTAGLALVALVAGLLVVVQVVAAPLARAASFPVGGPGSVPEVTAQPKSFQDAPYDTTCSDDDGGSSQPVTSLRLLRSSADAGTEPVNDLTFHCEYPAGAPVSPPLPGRDEALVPDAVSQPGGDTGACAAPTPVLVGLNTRWRSGTLVSGPEGQLEFLGDALVDVQPVCGVLGSDGRAYGARTGSFVTGDTDWDGSDFLLCQPGEFVNGFQGSSDAPYTTPSQIYALGIRCDAPTFDPAAVAATYPRTTTERRATGIGDVTGSDFIPAACGGGVLGTGFRIDLQGNEGGGIQTSSIGVDCTRLAAPEAPATLDPDSTVTAAWPLGADPFEEAACPTGTVLTGAVGYGTEVGPVQALTGIRGSCSQLDPDGTTSYVDGEPVGTDLIGQTGDAFATADYCPADQVVTGIALALTDATQYGTTPTGLNLLCSAVTLAAAPPAANSSWTTATEVGPNSTTTQALTAPGGALWFKVPTTAGSTLSATLSDLPVDDDLTVFGDIGNAFLGRSSLSDQQSLTRLSAQFAAAEAAPTTFSPTTFSPTTFSPTTFSPTTFSPTTFSPTTFSPTTFSPTTFSPTTFSPTTFSPTTFSPTTFSPTTFSPAAPLSDYIRSGLFPDVDQLANAFSAAQVQSLLAVSAHTGTTPETYSAPTWNRGGYTYLRVTGRNGASSPSPVTLTVSSSGGPCAGVALQSFPGLALLPAGATPAGTVVLTDTGRFGGASTSALTTANAALARAAVPGGPLAAIGPVAVVDLAASPRVQALQAQSDANPSCPTAANLAAQGIRDIVNAYRVAGPSLQYVTIEGSDHVVPFFRYADTAGVAPESGYVPPVGDATASNSSLRGDFVLGQDAYGSAFDLTIGSTTLPVPDLPVGRVVETPAEIAATLQSYLASNGAAIVPSSTLATGYDFLAAGAKQIASSFAAANAGTGATNATLITDQGVDRTVLTANGKPSPTTTWTAADLRSALLGSRHDVVYLAGHFSASAALAADFTSTLTTRDLVTAAGSTFRNTLVFSAGCHSGYNLVDGDAVGGVTDPLDWAQAFAQAGATLVAGTGYQYGDTDFVKYSNQLYVDFTTALRTGAGAVSVGSALVQAKRAYLAGQASLDGVDQKSLLQATVFGLPMQGVNFRTGRLAPPAAPAPVTTTAVTAQPGLTFGLQTGQVQVSPQLTPNSKALTTPAGDPAVTATWYSGPGGAVDSSPGQPTVPVVTVDATAPTGTVLRGVGFRSGTYTDTPGVTPLTGAPATETNTVHGPFVSDVFTPSRTAAPNYFDALSGGGSNGATRLFVTPAQYRSDAPGSLTDTQRVYSGLGFVTYYSGSTATYGSNQPAAAAPPSISGTSGSSSGGTVSFSTHVVGDPSAGVHGVWATWTVVPRGGGQGTWQSVDLTQDAGDSTLWTGQVALPAGASASDVRFMVQAVNGVGVVGVDDALGAYHRVDVPSVPPPAAVLTMGDLPLSAVAGGTLSLGASLEDASGRPIAGQPVLFSIGASSAVGVTDGSGNATATVPVPSDPGAVTVTASYAGSDGAGSTAAEPVQLVLGARPTSATVALTGSGYRVTVQDTTNPTKPVGLPARTAFLVATGANGAVVAVRPVILDATGSGVVAPSSLPPGARFVTAWFGSARTPLAAGGTLDLTDPLFAAATSAPLDLTPTSITLGGASVAVAGSAVPFTVTARYPATTLPVTTQSTLTIASSGGAAVPGATCSAGSCSATTAGSYVVSASYLGRTATRAISITAAGLAVLTPSPATATITAGTTKTYTVTATDRYGNPLGAGTTTFAIAPVTGGSTIGASCNGFTCTATVAGTYAVTATRSGVSGKAALTVVAAAPATVTAVTGGNQSAPAGASFPTALTAQVQDLYGNPVAGAAVTFAAPAPDATTGAVTFPGGVRSVVVRTAANGVATAPTLTAGTQAGPVTLTAAVPGVASPASFTVAVTSSGPARADLAVSGRVTSSSATALTVTLTVRNNGPSTAKPVGAALWVARGGTISAAAGGRIVTPRLATFAVASLASGATTTVTVTVTRASRNAAVAVLGGALSGVVDPRLGDNLTVVFG